MPGVRLSPGHQFGIDNNLLLLLTKHIFLATARKSGTAPAITPFK